MRSPITLRPRCRDILAALALLVVLGASPPATQPSPLDSRLNDIASWNYGSGVWNTGFDGITGRGESSLSLKANILPEDCTIEFDMLVHDGLRPRIFLEGAGIYIGTEGDKRTLAIYSTGIGDFGAVEVAPQLYDLNQPLKIKAAFNKDTFQVTVNDKVIGHGPRLDRKPIGIRLSTGDGWSQGTATFDHFHVTLPD